jgi:hypothetical protein
MQRARQNDGDMLNPTCLSIVQLAVRQQRVPAEKTVGVCVVEVLENQFAELRTRDGFRLARPELHLVIHVPCQCRYRQPIALIQAGGRKRSCWRGVNT